MINETKKYITISIICIFGVPFFIFHFYNQIWAIQGLDGVYPANHCWSQPQIAPIAIEANPHLTSIWANQNIYISPDDFSIPLKSFGEIIYLFGAFESCQRMALSRLRAETGEVINYDILTIPDNLGIDIVSNSNHLYVGYHGPGKAVSTSTSESGGIIAYDLSMDAISWSKIISGTREINSIMLNDRLLAFDAAFATKRYLIDARTGVELDSQSLSFEGEFPSNNQVFWYKSFAHSQNENELLPLLSNTYQSPILLSNGDLIIRLGPGNTIGRILRVTPASGKILWEHGNVTSNAAILDNLVFYITENLELNAVDLNQGNILFSLDLLPHQMIDTRNASYIATNNNKKHIYIYLDSSRQLIAFELASN